MWPQPQPVLGCVLHQILPNDEPRRLTQAPVHGVQQKQTHVARVLAWLAQAWVQWCGLTCSASVLRRVVSWSSCTSVDTYREGAVSLDSSSRLAMMDRTCGQEQSTTTICGFLS